MVVVLTALIERLGAILAVKGFLNIEKDLIKSMLEKEKLNLKNPQILGTRKEDKS